MSLLLIQNYEATAPKKGIFAMGDSKSEMSLNFSKDKSRVLDNPTINCSLQKVIKFIFIENICLKKIQFVISI